MARGGCSLRSNGEKGSGIGRLTANSSLSGPQGPGTFVRQNAVMASPGPWAEAPGANAQGSFPPATAPCTGPPTSLFRQFAPELFLLRLRLAYGAFGVQNGPFCSPGSVFRPSVCKRASPAHRGCLGTALVCKSGHSAHRDLFLGPSVCNWPHSAHRGWVRLLQGVIASGGDGRRCRGGGQGVRSGRCRRSGRG